MTHLSRPLCVDLDGTLTPVDTLHESLLALVGRSPEVLLRLPVWLLSGKAGFKAKVAAAAPLATSHLPWREDLLAWLRDQRTTGRRLVLVTAADQQAARAVAAELGLFDEIIASDGRLNLSGDAKRAVLVARYGPGGYDYVGNSAADLPVWREAGEAIAVDAPPPLVRRAAAQARLTQAFPRHARLAAWWRALRPHQWLKNLLVFVPVLLSHQMGDAAASAASLAAFIAFCLCASSVYLLNDLFDLEADRRHPRKRRRPFAAGLLPALDGMGLAAALLAASLLVAAAVGPALLGVLSLYYGLTLAYSLRLKRLPVMDVLLLAALYTIRILAGVAATAILPSFWLLAFSGFLFLSLGIVKRYAELESYRVDGGEAHGRGYHVSDLPLLANLGVSAGIGAVIILALYVHSPQSQQLYADPWMLWLLCPLLLYWVARIWFVTYRGEMHDDPIIFALRDTASRVVALLTMVILVVAV
jgi:4-hydroxybenzoate polyprenyltransferase/phosphoserine phosphatase